MLIPLGQPLGQTVEANGDSWYRVRLGSTTYRLTGPQAEVWLAAHLTRPSAETGIDRALLATMDMAAVGVSDPLAEVDLLIALGLLVELDLIDREAVQAFSEQFRLQALQLSIGNSPTMPESYTLMAGQATTTVDAVMHRIVASCSVFEDIRTMCFAESGALIEREQTEPFGDPEQLIFYVLLRLHVALAAHAVFVDLAHDMTGRRQQQAAAREIELGTDPNDETPLGVYAVGYCAGAVFDGADLRSFSVVVGHGWLELQGPEELATWTAAHGVVVEDGADDSLAAICGLARELGATLPIFDIDALAERGLVAEIIGGKELVEFAANHRLQWLQVGIGNTSAEPGMYALGPTPDGPLMTLTEREFAVWRDAPLRWSLLAAANDAGMAGSVAELRDYLRFVQQLCAVRAAYIGRAVSG